MSPDHNNKSEAQHEEMMQEHLHSIDSGMNAKQNVEAVSNNNL